METPTLRVGFVDAQPHPCGMGCAPAALASLRSVCAATVPVSASHAARGWLLLLGAARQPSCAASLRRPLLTPQGRAPLLALSNPSCQSRYALDGTQACMGQPLRDRGLLPICEGGKRRAAPKAEAASTVLCRAKKFV